MLMPNGCIFHYVSVFYRVTRIGGPTVWNSLSCYLSLCLTCVDQLRTLNPIYISLTLVSHSIVNFHGSGNFVWLQSWDPVFTMEQSLTNIEHMVIYRDGNHQVIWRFTIITQNAFLTIVVLWSIFDERRILVKWSMILQIDYKYSVFFRLVGLSLMSASFIITWPDMVINFIVRCGN